MVNLIFRTVIVYSLLIITLRCMGQKQAGQLQAHEMVVTLLIAEIATVPIDDNDTPLLFGILPALILALMCSFINYLCRKSLHIRTYLCGTPSVLIHNGALQYQEINRIGYPLTDLMEQLRIAGQTDITSIQYAILETNGQLSVLPYADQAPLTPAQASLVVTDAAFYSAVLIDGCFHKSGLAHLHLSADALRKFIHRFGYSSPKEVLIMTISDTGDVFLQDRAGNTHTATLSMECSHA